MHPIRLRAEKPLAARAAHGAPFFQNSKAESAARAPAPRPESRQPPQAEPGRFEDASAGSREGNRPGFPPVLLDSLPSTPLQALRNQAQITDRRCARHPYQSHGGWSAVSTALPPYLNDDGFETISSKQATRNRSLPSAFEIRSAVSSDSLPLHSNLQLSVEHARLLTRPAANTAPRARIPKQRGCEQLVSRYVQAGRRGGEECPLSRRCQVTAMTPQHAMRSVSYSAQKTMTGPEHESAFAGFCSTTCSSPKWDCDFAEAAKSDCNAWSSRPP